jgi:hypothetical protein
MNLKMGNGRVPIPNMNGDYQYLLVDFPSREWFDVAYKRNKPEDRDKYWDILIKRSKGYTLFECGYVFSLTRERVRQIEAKFIRRVTEHYMNKTSGDLAEIELLAFSNKKIRAFLETETQ